MTQYHPPAIITTHPQPWPTSTSTAHGYNCFFGFWIAIFLVCQSYEYWFLKRPFHQEPSLNIFNHQPPSPTSKDQQLSSRTIQSSSTSNHHQPSATITSPGHSSTSTKSASGHREPFPTIRNHHQTIANHHQASATYQPHSQRQSSSSITQHQQAYSTIIGRSFF